jgi:hypothetical protein
LTKPQPPPLNSHIAELSIATYTRAALTIYFTWSCIACYKGVLIEGNGEKLTKFSDFPVGAFFETVFHSFVPPPSFLLP